jgi:hypothetical protein
MEREHAILADAPINGQYFTTTRVPRIYIYLGVERSDRIDS